MKVFLRDMGIQVGAVIALGLWFVFAALVASGFIPSAPSF
jgi:hypothetical protein